MPPHRLFKELRHEHRLTGELPKATIDTIAA